MNKATAFALVAAAALCAPAPAHAVAVSDVIGPVTATWGGDLFFDPYRAGLLLDITPGALVSATFRFEGNLRAFGSAFLFDDPAAVPAETSATTSLRFDVRSGGRQLAGYPLAPLTVTVRSQTGDLGTQVTFDGSERRTFEVTVPGSVYEEGWGTAGFHFDRVIFGIDPRLGNRSSDALFNGTASAVFTYLTADELAGVPLPVPEPASWALLGLGLVGLGAIRRRAI